MPDGLAERLARVRDRSTLRLTHYGRRSGKPYQVTIWFMVDGATVYLGTMNRDRQWTRNVVARPDVELAVDGERFRGRVTLLESVEAKRHAYELMVAKYWIPWAIDRVVCLAGRDPRPHMAGGRGAFYRVDLHAD